MGLNLPYRPKQDLAPKTALMVFSLSAALDGRRKPLFGVGRRSETKAVFQWLISRTASVVEASGLEVVWADESKQEGRNFGERFTSALARLFAEGYDKVIAIGNDSPGLNPEILQRAVLALQKNTLVLGPARDGGDYLIGINRADFQEAAFLDLPWNTKELHQQLVLTAEREGRRVSCLDELTDIDDNYSLKSYLQQDPDSGFSRFVTGLLQELHRPDLCLKGCLIAHQLYAPTPLRGPPTIFRCYFF